MAIIAQRMSAFRTGSRSKQCCGTGGLPALFARASVLSRVFAEIRIKRNRQIRRFDGLNMNNLTNARLRELKAQAQQLKATLRIGKDGLSPQFLAALDDALRHRELVKVKFDYFKERKKELSPELSDKSGSRLITRVGNVVVLYRPKP